MDENKYLILLKGKDKTSDILSYTTCGAKVDIKFKSLKSYLYECQNVILEENPAVTDVADQMIYYKNIPLSGVKQILNFNGRLKLVFEKRKSEMYDFKSIKIVNNCLNKDGVQAILNYWKAIAQYTKIDNAEDAFLKREYDRLTFISPESVLGCYLNKEPLQCLNHDTEDIIFPFSFNLSQKQALENALKANISVIEGPPGTGKTQSILNIIANLAIMQGKTVAIVSGNNAAVQNVKDKLEKEQYGFLVAALGKKDNRTVFFKNLPQYDLTNWNSEVEESVLLNKINSLNSKINYLLDLNNEKAKIQQELAAYYIERQHFDVYYGNQNIEEIKRLLFYRRKPERVISFLADHYFAVEEQKSQSFIYKLKLLIKYGFTDFKKLKENEIDILLNLQKEYYDLKILCLEQRKKALEQELANAKFKKLLTQHKEYSTILFKKKLYSRYHDKNVKFDGNSYKSCFDKFIERFPVVLSTTHSLRNCIPSNYLFDYLIIDESSQVDLLSGALALSCSKHAIIVGDTKQLPQIVDEKIKGKIQAVDVENIYDYFQHNMLSSMLALYQDMPRVVLKEHYRCHPKIIGFCNQKYYHGELIPFTQEDTSDEPFILYRTAKGNHMREVTKGERIGKFNQREMDVILEEVLKNPRIATNEILEIGFTTPYRNQADRASKTFDNGMECDTVHKYQGREKKVMIMSTVLDNTFSGKKGLTFVDDPCKVNVAVSRAQNQFILVTDNSLFDKVGKEISDLVRYIEYHTLDDNLIESEIVSVFDLLYKEYSSKLIALKNRLPDISKYQSENIIWRLLHNIISEDKYNCLEFTVQVLLKNLLKNNDKLTPEEVRYVNHNSSVDFVVYYRLNKKPVLIIEIDGFAFHENNPKQLVRDALKDSALKKYGLPLLRLATTGSGEEEKIKKKLDAALNED